MTFGQVSCEAVNEFARLSSEKAAFLAVPETEHTLMQEAGEAASGGAAQEVRSLVLHT